MSDFSDTVNSIFNNLNSLLRYVFPPIVGFLVILMGLGCRLEGKSEYILFVSSNLFFTLLFIFAFGLAIYHMHRAVIHHIPAFVIMSIIRHLLNRCFYQPPIYKLNFARWIRRNSKVNEEAQAVQRSLDTANAATHFLYCSGWSALMWFFVFKYSLNTSLSHPFIFGLLTFLLLVFAILGEFWTAFHDLKAYQEYSEDGKATSSEA